MKSSGKRFEDNFKKSLNLEADNLFYYRFKDGTANWGDKTNSNVRFQAHNISDCMIFYNGILFICELKSHKGKSLPLDCIRENQYNEMLEASMKKNVACLLFVYFSDVEECYAIPIQKIRDYKRFYDKKSINIQYFQEKGFKLEVKTLKTNIRVNIMDFLRKVAG